MPRIRFEATPYTIDGATVLRLPERASRQLPSRGQVAVKGTMNGDPFETVLEPDGMSGHWMRIDSARASTRKSRAVALEVEPLREWPEPNVPPDLAKALASAPTEIRFVWTDITPMARWEWVRWVNATKNPDTRRHRVEMSISKMKSGKRRPCCFDLSSCTDPDLARNGRLASLSDRNGGREASRSRQGRAGGRGRL